MADGTRFEVKLVDKVKGPAASATKALGKLDAQARSMGRRFADVGGRMRDASGRMMQGASSAKVFGRSMSGAMDVFKGNVITMAAQKVVGLATSIVGAAWEMTTFGQNSRLAFEQLAKHGATPIELFDHARALAKRFGLDLEDTTHQYQKFLALQFSPAAADRMIRMGADLRALGNDAESVQGVFLALGQIKGKGRLQAQEMLQLAERGVSTVLVQEEIGKLMGGKSTQQVQKLQEAGKVSAEIGLTAIENAIKRKLGESSLGEAGARFADTTLDGITGRFKTFAQDAGVRITDKLAGPLTSALQDAMSRLDVFLKSPEGDRMITSMANGLERMANAAIVLGRDLGKAFAEADWTAIGNDVTTIARGLADIVSNTAKLMRFVAGANERTGQNTTAHASYAGFIGGGAVAGAALGSVVPVIGTAAGAVVGGLAGGLLAGVENLGIDVSRGFASDKAQSVAYDAGHKLGSSVGNGARAALGVHSPSRVAMGIGLNVGRGLAIGMERSAPLVEGANARLTDAAAGYDSSVWGPEMSTARASVAADAGRGAGAGDVSVTITQYVQGTADPEETARISAREARREIEDFFADLAMEA